MKKLIILGMAVIVTLCGCETTENLSGHARPGKGSMARLRVRTLKIERNVKTWYVIQAVGKFEISEKSDYVSVEPGSHILGIGWYEETWPEGTDARHLIDQFGHRPEHFGITPQVRTSTNLLQVTLVAIAGHTYGVTASEFFDVRGEVPEEVPVPTLITPAITILK